MLVIAVICFFSININAEPWNNNTREHLFGSVDVNNQVQASIQDEGFRWRNSFNFTIDGKNILPQNWWFNGVVYVNDNNELKTYNDFVQNVIFHENGKYISISPNSIHSHLAKIADKVKEINKCASATTAAVTIVVENGGNYYAFSKLLCNDSNKIIATRTLTNNRDAYTLVSYPDFTAVDIKNTIEKTQPVIDSNIPNPNKYSCSEGQIIAKIKCNNFELVKRIIGELRMEARQQYGDAIKYDNVKLVVLHIGTTMDPCAICTRCLVGISKYINDNINCLALDADKNMNNAKFLIEVSSNNHYATTTQYNKKGKRLSNDKQDNFAAFGCGNCSHTECAGHDGGENNQINISLSVPFSTALGIPYGIPSTPQNWILTQTFPPYVIFGRTDDSYNVVNASSCCDINNHAKHNGVSNLSLVQ